MKKLQNRGFSVVEGLLLVVLVALVAGIGYYVYTQSQKQDETSKPQSSSQAPTTETEDCKTKSDKKGSLLRSSEGYFSICILNGWKAINDEEGKTARVYPPFDYVSEKAAVITKQSSGGKDGVADEFQVFLADESYLGWATEDNAQKTVFTLNNGIQGARYYEKFGKPQADGPGPMEGDQAYEYLFTSKGGRHYHAVYTIQKGSDSKLDVIEEALKTLEFHQ